MFPEPLLKTKNEYKNLKKQGIQEMKKACFQHDTAFANFKDLSRKTASNKVLHDKACNTAQNPKYDIYQRELASMV